MIARAGPDGQLPVVAASHPRRPELAEAMRAMGPVRIPAPLAAAHRAGNAFILDPTPPDLLPEALTGDAAFGARAELGIHTTLVAPLAISGRTLGLMIVISTPDGRRFDHADLQLVEELARRVAGLVDADRSAAREHLMHDTSYQLAAATTLAEASAVLARSAMQALGASSAAVYTIHPEDPTLLHLEHEFGYPPQFAQHFASLNIDRPLATCRAARSGVAQWLGDHDAVTRQTEPVVGEWLPEVRAAASLPLRIGDRTLGVIALTFTTLREFTPEEQVFAATLVTQAAQAFDRRADRRPLAHRRDLQRALLPDTPPPLDRLAVATGYLPAAHDVTAGGDWYDVISLDADRTALVVGDVVGHGASAAAIMGQLRSALAAMLQRGDTPARALEHLNTFAARIPGARASSAACAVIDTATSTLRWACAGHPPPLLLTSHDRTARYLEGGAVRSSAASPRRPARSCSPTVRSLSIPGPRCCSTPTAWSNAPGRPSTTAWPALPAPPPHSARAHPMHS